LLGASYLAFCVIGLAVDRYRGQVKELQFLDFWNWVTFFPSFTAGPIRRFAPFAAQAGRNSAAPDIWWSLLRILVGLFKRIVLAETLTDVALFITKTDTGTLDTWFGLYAYSLKIYLEFSAYTDIAVGAAGLLGLRIEENFRWPYLATNISDFWKRWHMSLTGWLRDYLFIPLGGSRRSWARTALNSTIVMAVIGLWHGLSFHFLVWGLYHALGLLIFRAYVDLFRGGDRRPRPQGWRKFGGWLITFNFVTFGWLLFECKLYQVKHVLLVMFGGG